MTSAGNYVDYELDELFDKISNHGREWAQLVNRVRIVFERPTYIFPMRDAVYLWHAHKQKLAGRQEISRLLMRIIRQQDSSLVVNEIQMENKMSALWKHKYYLNERRLYDLTQKYLNLPFLPLLLSDGRLPFYDEMMNAEKPQRKRRRKILAGEIKLGQQLVALGESSGSGGQHRPPTTLTTDDADIRRKRLIVAEDVDINYR